MGRHVHQPLVRWFPIATCHPFTSLPETCFTLAPKMFKIYYTGVLDMYLKLEAFIHGFHKDIPSSVSSSFGTAQLGPGMIDMRKPALSTTDCRSCLKAFAPSIGERGWPCRLFHLNWTLIKAPFEKSVHITVGPFSLGNLSLLRLKVA